MLLNLFQQYHFFRFNKITGLNSIKINSACERFVKFDFIRTRRLPFIDQCRDLNRLNGQVTEANAEVCLCIESLNAVLGETSKCTLSQLVSRADTRVREAAETRKSRGEVTNKIRRFRSNLDAALVERRENESGLEEWRVLWAAALSGLPVSGAADQARPGAKANGGPIAGRPKVSAARYHSPTQRQPLLPRNCVVRLVSCACGVLRCSMYYG